MINDIKGEERKQMKLKHIPNILSAIRIGLVFVFVALFFTDNVWPAIFVFLLAGATDVVDGYLARRNNWVTRLGKVLDPFADKLMQCTVLVCLCIGRYIPIWVVIPFLAKEVLMLSLGAIVIKRRSVVVVSKWYGKLTICLFYGTIFLSVLLHTWLAANPIFWHLLFVPAVAVAIFSLICYIKQYAYLKNEEIQKGNILKNRKED